MAWSRCVLELVSFRGYLSRTRVVRVSHDTHWGRDPRCQASPRQQCGATKSAWPMTRRLLEFSGWKVSVQCLVLWIRREWYGRWQHRIHEWICVCVSVRFSDTVGLKESRKPSTYFAAEIDKRSWWDCGGMFHKIKCYWYLKYLPWKSYNIIKNKN